MVEKLFAILGACVLLAHALAAAGLIDVQVCIAAPGQCNLKPQIQHPQEPDHGTR